MTMNDHDERKQKSKKPYLLKKKKNKYLLFTSWRSSWYSREMQWVVAQRCLRNAISWVKCGNRTSLKREEIAEKRNKKPAKLKLYHFHGGRQKKKTKNKFQDHCIEICNIVETIAYVIDTLISYRGGNNRKWEGTAKWIARNVRSSLT